MAYPFRNIVFEGGGVKGIAYVGAMEVLGRRGILADIARVGGTSAGAINALLFALGYSNAATRQLVADLDFTTFLDDDWGAVRDANRLIHQFGWYRGDAIHAWLRERVADKLGDARATFSHLQAGARPALYVYGTNLSNGFGQVYSPEHTPGMMLADAARISLSIPLFFAAVLQATPRRPAMVTLQIDGGSKRKLRPGDILGALTGKGGIAGSQVGKIHVFADTAYVAVAQAVTATALAKLRDGKVKGRSIKVREVTGQPSNSRRLARRQTRRDRDPG